jgi:hypothetical protein
LTPIPAFDQIDFSQVKPGRATEYWEWRTVDGSAPVRTLVTGGTLKAADLSVETRVAMDARTPGAASGKIKCSHDACHQFVIALQNGAIRVFASPEALAGFLGQIDHLSEALLLLYARGYYGETANQHTGIRSNWLGWEMVAYDLVSGWCPRRVDRVRLEVWRSGRVTEDEREVWFTNTGCTVDKATQPRASLPHLLAR